MMRPDSWVQADCHLLPAHLCWLFPFSAVVSPTNHPDHLHLNLWVFNQSVCSDSLSDCLLLQYFRPDSCSDALFDDWLESAPGSLPKPVPSNFCMFWFQLLLDTDTELFCKLFGSGLWITFGCLDWLILRIVDLDLDNWFGFWIVFCVW